MKKKFKQDIKNAFNIPEPTRKDEFFENFHKQSELIQNKSIRSGIIRSIKALLSIGAVRYTAIAFTVVACFSVYDVYKNVNKINPDLINPNPVSDEQSLPDDNIQLPSESNSVIYLPSEPDVIEDNTHVNSENNQSDSNLPVVTDVTSDDNSLTYTTVSSYSGTALSDDSNNTSTKTTTLKTTSQNTDTTPTTSNGLNKPSTKPTTAKTTIRTTKPTTKRTTVREPALVVTTEDYTPITSVSQITSISETIIFTTVFATTTSKNTTCTSVDNLGNNSNATTDEIDAADTTIPTDDNNIPTIATTATANTTTTTICTTNQEPVAAITTSAPLPDIVTNPTTTTTILSTDDMMPATITTSATFNDIVTNITTTPTTVLPTDMIPVTIITTSTTTFIDYYPEYKTTMTTVSLYLNTEQKQPPPYLSDIFENTMLSNTLYADSKILTKHNATLMEFK